MGFFDKKTKLGEALVNGVKEAVDSELNENRETQQEAMNPHTGSSFDSFLDDEVVELEKPHPDSILLEKDIPLDPVKEAMAAALQITVDNAPPGSAMKTHAERALKLYNESLK